MSNTRQKYLASKDPILMGFLKNFRAENQTHYEKEINNFVRSAPPENQSLINAAFRARLIKGHLPDLIPSSFTEETKIEPKQTADNQIDALETLAKNGNPYALYLLGQYEFELHPKQNFTKARYSTYLRYTSFLPIPKALLAFTYHEDAQAPSNFPLLNSEIDAYNRHASRYHHYVLTKSKDELNKMASEHPKILTQLILDNHDWKNVQSLLSEPNKQKILKHWKEFIISQEKEIQEMRAAVDLPSGIAGIILDYSEHSFRPYPSPPKTEAQGPQNYPTNKELKLPSETKESKRRAAEKIPEQTWFDKFASFFQKHEKEIEKTHEKFAKKSPFDGLKKK